MAVHARDAGGGPESPNTMVFIFPSSPISAKSVPWPRSSPKIHTNPPRPKPWWASTGVVSSTRTSVLSGQLAWNSAIVASRASMPTTSWSQPSWRNRIPGLHAASRNSRRRAGSRSFQAAAYHPASSSGVPISCVLSALAQVLRGRFGLRSERIRAYRRAVRLQPATVRHWRYGQPIGYGHVQLDGLHRSGGPA